MKKSTKSKHATAIPDGHTLQRLPNDNCVCRQRSSSPFIRAHLDLSFAGSQDPRERAEPGRDRYGCTLPDVKGFELCHWNRTRRGRRHGARLNVGVCGRKPDTPTEALWRLQEALDGKPGW